MANHYQPMPDFDAQTRPRAHMLPDPFPLSVTESVVLMHVDARKKKLALEPPKRGSSLEIQRRTCDVPSGFAPWIPRLVAVNRFAEPDDPIIWLGSYSGPYLAR